MLRELFNLPSLLRRSAFFFSLTYLRFLTYLAVLGAPLAMVLDKLWSLPESLASLTTKVFLKAFLEADSPLTATMPTDSSAV